MTDYAAYKLYFNSVQSSTLKTLIEAMKDVLNDVTIHFKSDGFKVISMDGTKTTLVHMSLDGKKFEEYHCPNNFDCGVNMTSLFKLMKPISNNDTITMFIEKENTTELVIKIENSEKKTIDQSYLKLLDIDDDIINIPNSEFNAIITMPSADFQRYCRDMYNISDKVTLTSYYKKSLHYFEISCEGDFAKKKINIAESNNGLVVTNAENNLSSASGIFSLKYLNLFTKSTSLCSTVEIYLKDKYPLFLSYSISNLGQIRYCLAPKE